MNLSHYPLLSIEILGNSIGQWLLAAIVFLAVMAILKIFATILLVKLKHLAEKTKMDMDDILIDVINTIRWPFYVLVSFYAALQFVNVNELLDKLSYYLLLIAVVYYAIKAAQEFIDYGAEKIVAKREEKEEGSAEMIKILSAIVKASLWVVAVILILSNLGYNVTSLIAGLGIGGLAVALAIQNILSDIFSSLSIYFDKPFKVGDFIVVGDYKGTVKKIGIKTTRVQSLQGEEIVISNNELTSSKIQNFGLMERRRIVFTIGVTYDTLPEKLELVPKIIEELVGRADKAELDRVHFKTFGPSSMDYEIVYYVNSSDYKNYMDIQQSVNMELVRRFAKEGIEFAYPTQTVYIKK